MESEPDLKETGQRDSTKARKRYEGTSLNPEISALGSAKLPVSIAIITKDSDKKLRRCLASVSFAEEIVIVDSGSTDRTGEIAREFNARWFVEPWKGYGPQKNSAVQKCSHDWVLSIDSDECLTAEAVPKIAQILSENNPADAYMLRRKNHIHGKWIKVADWWPDYTTRLLRKGRGRFVRTIHEVWQCDSGRIERLDCAIEHYSHDSYSEMIGMLNNYSTLLAKQMHEEGKKAGPVDAILHSFWMFFRNYVLRLGFSAGFDGFMIALTKSLGTFLKYAKLYELSKFGAGKPMDG